MKPYFKGYYFKHRIGATVFAVIPGVAADENGKPEAFIQTIIGGHPTLSGSRYVRFPASECVFHDKPLAIRVGGSFFTEKGLRLRLPGRQASGMTADLRYGRFTPPSYDIMGPLAHIPGLECRHGVQSLHHPVRGLLRAGEETVDFTGGEGYLESDRGRSFPRAWFWLQAAFPDFHLMLAAAELPLLGTRFRGAVGILDAAGEQIRFATYLGARLSAEGRRFTVTQGRYRLEVTVSPGTGQKLAAPMMGKMDRMITEAPSCPVAARLYYKGERILSGEGVGSFERMGNL